ncbi:F-box/kelch-repeat protein At3g23880 [Spinacia oleracea]|uniref:F-box/kelch-repeat protein At3g23880 n=1 Tax=Spinacia oleracea TaxID=3562 RepID=A0A9R0IXG8_SPIOL|nr:F-box/kelch-repeat protein At3g23880-like [Spinacia oleracea]XP_056699488.1 F-box/kelch-repeat protein At3g23880-like [Spinacia oleracea]
MRTRRSRMLAGDSPEGQFLPPELQWEVMVRLPVKTLLRFRCICKCWRSIIDSPDFIFSHSNLLSNDINKTLMLVLENSKKFQYSQDHKQSLIIRDRHTFRFCYQFVESEQWGFLGSCNGLVLIQDIKFPSLLGLFNPCIRKALILPPCPIYFDKKRYYRTHPIFVLGFVSSCNDFKVVAFMDEESGITGKETSIIIAVYSLNDDLWRIKLVELNFPITVVTSKSWWDHFCQGAGHWIVNTHVFSFDFGVEEFSSVEFPNTGSEKFKYDFVLGESLAVFGISPISICIWIMRKDGGNDPWSLWFSGDSSFSGYYCFKYLSVKNFSYDVKSGTTYVLTANDGLISYNIKSHHIQRFGRIVRHCNLYHRRITNVYTYVESLVLSGGSYGESLISFP